MIHTLIPTFAWADTLDGIQQQASQIGQQALQAIPVERFKIFALLKDQNFLSAWQDIVGNGKWKTCLYLEVAFLIFMFFFKAWQQAEQRSWMGRIAVGFYCSIFFWLGELLVIPYLVYGGSYKTVTKGLMSLF